MSKKHVLEPIDIYGNWRVRTLPKKAMKFGLTPLLSTFKIKNRGKGHVLIKKAFVGWKGGKGGFNLSPLPTTHHAYADGLRLQARVHFAGQDLDVFFGSVTDGRTLRLMFSKVVVRGGLGIPHTGGFGTAGRGG
jgi:hypothetical protein